MKPWVFSGALAALAATAAFGQDAPKSLLPDVFGAAPPEAPPPPRPADTQADTPGGDTPQQNPDGTAAGLPIAATPATVDPFASGPARAGSFDIAGPLTARLGGYGMGAFEGSDGRFLNGLLQRTRPPLASRWGHIVLRRALLSRVPTPDGVRPADWLAERALLLLRMGEVDGAKLLVDALPLDRYTPRLYAVASQVHLAAADIPALCPLAPNARAFSKLPFWDAANAICAGLEGDDITAAAQFDRLRARRAMPMIDIVLAERAATVVSGEGRGANIDWDEAKSLSAYRFGLAAGAGIAIPEPLLARPSAMLAGWMMRAPGLSIAQRSEAAPIAAAYGIASARELAALAAARIAAIEPGADGEDAIADIRAAYAGRNAEERIAAMRRIWEAAETPQARYGALVRTAAAAARIPPAAAQADDAPELIESMLSAGYIRQALAWWPVLANGPEKARREAWPYLALADSTGRIANGDVGEARDWHGALSGKSADRKGAMFAAAMQALQPGGGWSGLAEDLGVGSLDNRYTRRIASAAVEKRRGEVAILAGIGLQSSWAGVSPAQLSVVVGALNRAGFAREARMMAVEAVTRN
ncbi:hypothetical protein [Sphingosinicella soli]|uniref:Antifreeze glycopeptide polyprotein n=1 Tax=Sphingosinicella soli TaxID=333708 RepID=A0A7W7F5G7_9SPHN|nr:hypothetical protein [Sphingosinicella soli]MBB4631400.1 hypothetical protein [Sphingosinicella soli]